MSLYRLGLRAPRMVRMAVDLPEPNLAGDQAHAAMIHDKLDAGPHLAPVVGFIQLLRLRIVTKRLPFETKKGFEHDYTS